MSGDAIEKSLPQQQHDQTRASHAGIAGDITLVIFMQNEGQQVLTTTGALLLPQHSYFRTFRSLFGAVR
jgi:hypothetical protein